MKHEHQKMSIITPLRIIDLASACVPRASVSAVSNSVLADSDDGRRQESKSIATVRRLLSRVMGITLLLGIVAPAMSANSEILSLPLIPRGSVWRYLDNGSNQGTNWIVPGFNHSSRSNGVARLGYGGDSEATTISFGPSSSAKYITTYFRRAFEISDANVFRSLKLRVI